MTERKTVEITGRHLLALWGILAATVPGMLATIEFIYMPRFEAAVAATIEREIRDPDNKSFIECLIAVSGNKILYKETSEDLAMFQNAIEQTGGTAFHRSEVRRLTDKKALELATMVNDQNRPCSIR